MSTNADYLYEIIPTGHRNAMYVPNDNTMFRKRVQKANLCGEEVIINVGQGYFKVDEYDDEDLLLLDEYLIRERGRAREMWIKANAMQRTIRERRNEIEGINSYSKRTESTEEFNQ